MRPALAVAMLAVLLLPAAPAGAQDPPAAPASLRLLEDPQGDSGVSAAGQGSPVDRWSATDVLALDASEGPQGVVLTVSVRALGGETVTLADTIFYEMQLVAKDTEYGIAFSYDGASGAAQASWCAPQDGFLRCFEAIPIAVDAPAGTLTLTVPHGLLVAADGSLLAKGDALTGFAIEARSVASILAAGYTMGQVDATDHAPDEGAGTVAWVVQNGFEQVGHLVATARTPVRVSNGEATTFLFEVAVKNTLDRRDTVALAASGAPGIWTVTFPVEETRIEPGETATIPVLVTTPFNHEHGAYMPFNVTATSRSDPLAVGQVQLAVRYTRVPQPAGHHDTVHLHSQGGSFFYINTLEEEEIPSEEETGSSFGGGCSFSGSVSGTSTLVPLNPQLQMGLDAAMDRTGLARIMLRSDTPVLGGSSVGGYFVTWPADEYPETCAYEAPKGTVLEIERSGPLTMDADTPIVLELPIKPLPFGDRVPYDPGLRFGLLLVTYQEESGSLPICCFDVGNPEFMAGSTFQLPLDEYHDPVDEYFSTLSGIDLAAVTAQQRLVNPGETAVFRVEAENLGTKPASFALELTGTHLEWASILGDDEVQVPAGAVRELAVAVTVPGDASHGELADLTLHAVKSDDDNVRSLIRLLTTVDTAADHPDDSAEVPGLADQLTDAEAPAPGWALALLAVVVGALARRSRR